MSTNAWDRRHREAASAADESRELSDECGAAGTASCPARRVRWGIELAHFVFESQSFQVAIQTTNKDKTLQRGQMGTANGWDETK